MPILGTMREELLYYIWKLQKFDKKSLRTTDGRSVEILSPGTLNKDSGPDFQDCHIKIDNISFYGPIEIHVKSSSWYGHKHDQDDAYNNVVLHVVWEENKEVFRKSGHLLPTLSLSSYIDKRLLASYESLMKASVLIPCQAHLENLPMDIWKKMQKKALFNRLEGRYNHVQVLLKKNKNDTEVTTYQLLAKNFGFKTNSIPFLTLSETVPLTLLKRNLPNLLYLEALLFGQAGFLDLPTEQIKASGYISALSDAYQYLKHKYKLKKLLTKSSWKFFRLRPANFPTIRIAQFAQFLHKTPSLFDFLLNTPIEKLVTKLSIAPSEYWQRHYVIGKSSKHKMARLGESSIQNILINTVVPLLVSYGRLRNMPSYLEKAIKILQSLPPEANQITTQWKKLGFPIENAYQSQAVLQLFNNFCTPKKCLNCKIGQYILRR